jgi:FdhD protein
MTDTVRARVLRWSDTAGETEAYDELAAEEPLEIRVGGRPVSVTMRTPGNDLELVAGFLLTEGLLSGGAVPLLRHEAANVVNAALDGISEAEMERVTRHVYTASSCGLCGKATVDALRQQFGRLEDDFTVGREQVVALLDRLNAEQPGFARTGGVHAAALFDAAGDLVALREDVGRHNAVDKTLGFSVLRRMLPLSRHMLLVSGRASFEILQKALGAGVPLIAAVSAPSSLAVSFAEESGQTLIAFLRPGRFNIYAHPERIRRE